MEKLDFQKRVRFILRFGKALHAVGSPAHTIEGTMQEMGQKVGIKGSFLSQPTSIISSFTDGDDEITRVERVEPMGVNLGKLSKVDTISREVIDNKISFEEGYSKLTDVLDCPDPFSKRIVLIYFFLSSMGFTVLFGGSWGELIASGLVGILIGLLSLIRPVGLVAQLFEAIIAIVAGFGTYLLAKLHPGLNVGVVLLSTLLIFMPGLFITIAISEIATQNLVSGTARLVGGIMILLKLTFGVFIGNKISTWFHFPSMPLEFSIIPSWVVFLTLPFTAFMSNINFKSNKEDWKWVCFAGIFGFTAAKVGTHYLGPELGMFFGGLCVGGGSNIFARICNKPSSIFQFPGIILLVPGSVGYRSLNFLFEKNVVSGLETAFTMVTLAMALVVGIFVGNILIKPRRSF